MLNRPSLLFHSGISLIGIIFFGRLWSYNLEFQLGFIINCVKNQLVSKLLSAGPTGPGPGGGSGSGSSAVWDLSQLVPNLESLKCQPDFDGNSELSNWKYQRLYTIIIEISDSNSSNKQSVTMGSIFYNQIIDLFKWPVQNCPDLVALGLLGCNSSSSTCKNEILKLTIPAFLGNHPNAAVILHTIWSTNELIGNGSGASGTTSTGTGGSGLVGTGKFSLIISYLPSRLHLSCCTVALDTYAVIQWRCNDKLVAFCMQGLNHSSIYPLFV